MHDLLNINEDNEILKLLKNEKVYYSDVITKINHYGLSQERSIILTDTALYNMKKKDMKRRIPYKEILGISFSNISNEFVVHGNNSQYDYHYNSQDKRLIISLIVFFYDDKNNSQIKLCEIPEKSLKNYVTRKKEKQKLVSYSKMDLNYLIDTKEFQENNMEYLFFGSDIDISNKNNNFNINNINNVNNLNIENNNLDKNVENKNSINNSSMNSQRTNTLNFVNNLKSSNKNEKNDFGTIFSKDKDIKKVSLSDFKILKVLGRGTFGKVCLVQYKSTKKYYAMKIIFPEEEAKFYSAIIGLALEYLHTHGIVYRDIKPDNILIDEDGYLKLADFGMAKMLKDKEKAFSLCGTPEYFAPEIITREGHNKSADWWSYGILLYEMLYGIPPFYSKNTEKMFELITKSDLKFPKKIQISDNAKDLIKKLLIKDQDLRLGAEGGFETIKNHSFFKGFDFKALEEKKLEAPFIPTLRGSMDVTNFDSKYTSEEVVTSEISPNTLEFIKSNQEQFEEFE